MKELHYFSEIDFATPEYDQTVKLRYEVLRKPLGIEFEVEDLAMEYDSHHIACFQMADQEIIGVLILKPMNDNIVKMRQVAIRPDLQSQGVGSALVKESERFARIKHFKTIQLHARHTATAFYLKNGYVIEGEPFIEVGIPHHKMIKTLI